MTIYPWQQAIWQKLMEQRKQLPHALLIQGPRDIGKFDFACALSAALLCEGMRSCDDPHLTMACGNCVPCKWLTQQSHPDFRLLEPPEETNAAAAKTETETDTKTKGGKEITISQIRELNDFINLTTHRNGLRIILIHPAEAMNQSAANALLKTLEEPPDHTLFILVSDRPQRLLPTIVSRCRKVIMPFPAGADALLWLTQSGVEGAAQLLAQEGGMPLAVVRNNNDASRQRQSQFLQQLGDWNQFDPLLFAQMAEKMDISEVLMHLQKWVYDLLSLITVKKVRYYPEHQARLQEIAGKVNLMQLLEFNRTLLSIAGIISHPINLQMLNEKIFILYNQLLKSRREPVYGRT